MPTHIKSLFKHPFFTAMLAYGSLELAARIFRLFTVIVMAWQMTPEYLGVAALSLSCFEIIRVLANIGVGQQIIAASDQKLEATCNSGHIIFWIWLPLVAIVQTIVALILWFGFGQALAGQMLMALSAVYIFMPGGLIPCFRLMRDKKLKTTARISAQQTIADHILTAILLLIWPSPWAIVLPKLITAPLWLIWMRSAYTWQRVASAGQVPMRPLLGFSIKVLSSDVMLAARSHCDKLIIGACFGMGALGTYYFAFNAGISIMGSLIAAFGTVLYPYLCAAPQGAERLAILKRYAGLGAAAFAIMLTAQILLAPIYVPLVFGAKWAMAVPLIMILALAAIPTFIATIIMVWTRSANRPGFDLILSTISSIAALSALYLGSLISLEMAAASWVFALLATSIPAGLILIIRQSAQQRNPIFQGVAS
ncbi:oligosaccharide flippase family protein [Parasphingorhabdus sp. DH2-15]|uniref:oligosaccharide flippase family protein n=1 Tax=Parasphingorhabdus sp. DH2-15 TaxID=3444112 RepID=UPI003F68825F